MGSLKTLVLGVLVLSGLAGPALSIDGTEPGAHLKVFATCAGRMSAQMEHQWLFETHSEQTEARRDAVLDILAAMMPADAGRQVLNWRIDAKMAHASLLTRASFNADTAEARRASRMATQYISECFGLIPG